MSEIGKRQSDMDCKFAQQIEVIVSEEGSGDCKTHPQTGKTEGFGFLYRALRFL